MCLLAFFSWSSAILVPYGQYLGVGCSTMHTFSSEHPYQFRPFVKPKFVGFLSLAFTVGGIPCPAILSVMLLRAIFAILLIT